MHGDVDGMNSEISQPLWTDSHRHLMCLVSKKGCVHIDYLTGRIVGAQSWPVEGGELICKSSPTSAGAVSVLYLANNKFGVTVAGAPFRLFEESTESMDGVKGILATVGRYAVLACDLKVPDAGRTDPFAVCVTTNVFLDRCVQAALLLIGIKRFSRSSSLQKTLSMDVMRLIGAHVWRTRFDAAWEDGEYGKRGTTFSSTK